MSRPDRVLNKLFSEIMGTQDPFATVGKIMYNGEVVEVFNDTKLIRVRIPGIDNKLTLDKIPTCIPLLPSFIYCLPKVGEHVMVILQNPWSTHVGRYYIGPIFSDDVTDNESYEESVKGLGLKNLETVKK